MFLLSFAFIQSYISSHLKGLKLGLVVELYINVKAFLFKHAFVISN